MSWSEQIFRYCERGSDPQLWAEPLNAVSNLAFVIGAGRVLREIRARRRRGVGGRLHAEAGLAVLVAVIGIGSFLFHTFATRWAMIADVAPIGVFMIAYLAYALRILLRLGWPATAGGLAVFVVALKVMGEVQCARNGLMGIAEVSRGPCLNGTLGYLPALIAMAGVGIALWVEGHAAARLLLLAAVLFLGSMAMRTIDLEICPSTRLAGRAIGTHFLWHLANAVTLTLLLAAALCGREKSSRESAGQAGRQQL